MFNPFFMDEQNNIPTQEAPVVQEQPKVEAKSEDTGRLCAVLSYFLVGIIWYFADETMKTKELAKFHVKQSLVLLIVSIVLQVVGTVLPIIGWFIILPLASLFTFIWAIIGIVYALNREMKELPLIGGYAKKFTF